MNIQNSLFSERVNNLRGGFTLGVIEEKAKKQFRGITNERQSIIKSFVDELNKERDVTKFKPVTGRQIANKLSILKTNQELYEFLSECKDYKVRKGSFGKRFWGGFKLKK